MQFQGGSSLWRGARPVANRRGRRSTAHALTTGFGGCKVRPARRIRCPFVVRTNHPCRWQIRREGLMRRHHSVLIPACVLLLTFAAIDVASRATQVTSTHPVPSTRPATAPANLPGVRRILFLGDSITYAGGYIDYVDLALLTHLPGRRVELLDLGIPSETTSGLSEPGHPFPRPDVHERLDRTLKTLAAEGWKPDLVVACYGMNDGVYMPLSDDRFRRLPGRHPPAGRASDGGRHPDHADDPPAVRPPAVAEEGRHPAGRGGGRVLGPLRPIRRRPGPLWRLAAVAAEGRRLGRGRPARADVGRPAGRPAGGPRLRPGRRRRPPRGSSATG